MHVFNVIVTGVMMMLNNNVTWAIWVSLEGCYRNISGVTENHTLAANNGPRHCFGVCQSSTYIGLQDIFCLCDAKPVDSSYTIERDFCNYPCHGEKVNLPCGSTNSIYVYHKGFQFDYYATNNTSEELKIICYDGTTCRYNPLGYKVIWEVARSQCLQYGAGLPSNDRHVTLCLPQMGDFWIGVVWIIPVLIVTTKDTSTSTTPTSTDLFNATTSETRYFQSISNASSDPGKQTHFKESTTPPREMENKTKIVAAAVSAAFAALFAVVSVVICWKNKCLCFRLHPERNQEGARKKDDGHDSIETGENDQAFPATNPIFHTPTAPYFPSCVPPVSTSFKIHNTSDQDIKNGSGKGKKKKRKKDKKSRHRVHPTDETDEMAINKEIGSLHPDASGNERQQYKKKKKKKNKKGKKKYDREPDDISAISDKTIVPQSHFDERESSLGHKHNDASASEVTLTYLNQDGTASNVNTSEDRSKGTLDDEIIHKKEKKKKRNRERVLENEIV